MKQAAAMIVEQMLNAEVDDRLGRMPSQRVGGSQAGAGSPFTGYRNGYKSRRLKTAEGRLDVDVPQVRDYPEGPYRSEIWTAIRKKSPALQRLACEMYARGLSTRDIEQLLGELCESQGDLDQTLLSRSAVSQVTATLWEEYEAFTKRDLAGYDVVYLFCDAVYESIRQQTGVGTSQAILVSWAICSDGSKQLLHMSMGNKESADAWLEHFRSLVSRNLPTPLTVTSDGAPGTIKAIATPWRASQRWRGVRFTPMEKQQLEAYIRVRRAMGKNVRSLAARTSGRCVYRDVWTRSRRVPSLRPAGDTSLAA